MSKKHKYFNQKNNFQKIKTTLIPCNYAVPTHKVESRIKFIDFHLYYPSIENHSNLGGDPYGQKLSIKNTLSCPKGSLVMECHDYSAKDWGDLGARSITPINIYYEPKINSRTVQVEMNGAGARQEGGTAEGGTDIVGATQGDRVNGRSGNRADELAKRPVHVVLPAV